MHLHNNLHSTQDPQQLKIVPVFFKFDTNHSLSNSVDNFVGLKNPNSLPSLLVIYEYE